MSDNGDVISITVPERYADRFRVEAEHHLGTITEREIRTFEDAAHVFRQTREQPGELNIEGSVRVLQSCVHGVLLDVT